jgi:hypothetical protein
MTCFIRTLLVAMLATPWLPGTSVVQTTAQNTGVVTTTVQGRGVLTTTAQGSSMSTITTTDGGACHVSAVPGDDYVTESLFPSEFPCFDFARNSSDVTDLSQARGTSEPPCCPLCAKKARHENSQSAR